MASKPIDKDYLKSTLLSFDGSVLERKYARKTDIAEQHTHDNKDTLDKFSEFSDGTLLFNGNEISSEWEDIENKPFESLDNNTLGVENGVLKVVNVQETMQVSKLPAPTVDTLDKIYQYIGTTTSDYTNGLFYRCEEVLDSNCDVTGYTWNELSLQTEEEINRYVLKEELENHAMSVSHITSGERTAWNNKAESDDIPTKVSDLQDDVNLSDIHRHANKEDILDKLSANSNGQLLFNNELVSSGIEISSDPNNIIENKPDGICASVDLSDYAKTNDVITSSATRTESSVDSAISNTHNHTNKSDVLDKLGTNADGKLTFDNTVVGTSTEISQDADNVISLGSDGGVYYRPDHTHDNKDYLDKIGEDNGEFTYNGNRISSDIEISTRVNNALQRETDGSYYVEGTNYDSLENRLDYIEQDYVKNNQGAVNVGKTFKVDELGNVVLTDYISIQVDDALSDTSINPVQNRIVTNKLNLKGETLFYDEDNGQLQLKCGDEVLSSVIIVSGRNTSFLLGEPSSVQLTNLDEAVEIKWTDPDDVIIGGSILATWSGTVVVRKAGSAPMDKNDGIIIIDSRTKNQYSENGFVDKGLSNDVTYYYGIFPYSTEDDYTNTYTDSITPTAIYPMPPIDVSLKASNEQIEVTFTKPSDATGIRIVYSTTEPTSETDGTIINTTESPYTITGLTNDTTYYIVVYSYNEKGRFSGSDILSEQPYGSGLVAWTTGSDRAIINMVNAYYNGDITLDEVKSVWSVGDTREMNLSAMEAEYVGESHEAQTVELTIIDFDHDDLVNSVNGKTKSLVTVQTKNCLYNPGYINSTVANDGGWEECARRSWCNDTFKNAVPSIISNSIKNVIKENYKVYNDTTITTTSDYCFLLSETEVFGSYGNSVGAEEGVQYEYYKTTSNRVKYSKGFSTVHGSVRWWERSPYVGGASAFCDVDNDGSMDRCIATTNNGLAPAFCL